MSRKAIQKIVNKFYKQFKDGCKKITKDFDKEELHQLRVIYKKLRALTRLLTAIKQEDRFSFSKKIKKLYHIAGCVRDYQLQYDRISKTAPTAGPKPYLRFLKKSIRSFEKDFVSISIKKKFKETKEDLKQLMSPAITADLFQLFFNQQWNLVQAIVRQQHFSDENLHSIRKCIKDIHYNLDIYTASISTILPSYFPVKNIQHMKSLLDVLGDHQDLHKALELLGAKLVEQYNAAEQKQLADIKLMLMAEKLELKKQAVSKLKKEFIFKEQR